MRARVAATCLSAWAAWLAAAAPEGGPAGSPATRRPSTTRAVKRTVFAAPFENATGRTQYEPAAAGMGDLVAVLLARQEHVAVVERQRLAALAAEQALALRGLTGRKYAIEAGKLLAADTVLVGRLYLVKGWLTVHVEAVEIATTRVVAAGEVVCRPEYLPEAALQTARKLGRRMALPLPAIDLKQVDASPVASLHFAHALSCYYAGNMDEALMQLMRTIDLDPNYAEVHYWSGMCYRRLEEWSHAVIDWERFLRDQPDSPYATEVRELLAEARRKDAETAPPRPAEIAAPASAPAPECDWKCAIGNVTLSN